MVYAFLQELLHVGIYKRSQGRYTRQVTFAAIVVAVLYGAWRLNVAMMGWSAGAAWYAWLAREEWRYGIPALLVLLGAWAAFRLVNVPDFADFLIAVEAEMAKVSWPSRSELIRSCVVVLVTIFLLAAVLFAFDFIWGVAFRRLGVL